MQQSFLIKPPILNERLRAQQGVFIFSQISKLYNACDMEQNKKILNGEISKEKIKELHFEKKPISLDDLFEILCIIPSKDKESIINELDKLGINMATLFPDEEHQMRYVYDKYLREKKSDRWCVAKIDNL